MNEPADTAEQLRLKIAGLVAQDEVKSEIIRDLDALIERLSSAPAKDGCASPRDAPSDEVVEIVAQAIYDTNTPSKHCVPFDGLHPLSQKKFRLRALAAIHAYQKATGGDTRGEANK